MANNELTQVNIIEGLVSQIHGHLEAIHPHTAEQAEAKDAARNKLSSWESNQLFQLRKEFEKSRLCVEKPPQFKV